MPSRDLAARFEAYGDWRRRLSAASPRCTNGCASRISPTRRSTSSVQQLLERLHQDKLVVAFVAEFSRGKSELINAIFFADFGAAAAAVVGRAHDDVPDRAPLRRRRGRRRSACCRSRRALKDATVAEFKNYADEWVTIPLDLSSAERMGEALSRVSQVKRVPVALARKYGLYDDEDDLIAALEPRRRGRGRHPVLAPRGHQLPASAAAAGPRHPRHAGPERDRHRARAHAQPAAERARGAVHPRRRRRRDQDRPRSVEPSTSPATIPPTQRRAHRHPEQDRRPVGRASKPDAEVDAEIDAPGAHDARSCSDVPPAQVFAVSAQKALLAKVNGDDALLARSRLPQLEDALSQKLIPAKRDIVGAATQSRGARARRRRARDPRQRGTPASPSSSPSCARCAARTRTSSST